MRRSALRKKANNSTDLLATKLYKRKSNYAVNLNRKDTKDYFQKLIQHGSSSKNCWKFCKLFFTKPQALTAKLWLWKRKR